MLGLLLHTLSSWTAEVAGGLIKTRSSQTEL